MDAYVQKRQILGLPGFTDIFPDPAKGHSTSVSATSSSSSVSTSASDSSSSSSASSSSISSSSSSASPTSSTAEVTPSPLPDFSTTTSQSTQTVIAPAADASTSPAASAAPTHTAFLQNKVLSGLVFALVGIVGIVVIVSVLTFVIRRKRTRRFVEDAVSFDPVKMGAGYPDALEAGRRSPPQASAAYPRSSTSTGRASSNGNGPEIRQAAPFADYAPPPPPPPPPHSQMYSNSSASLRSYQSQQGYNYGQQQQSAYTQPFNWAAPPPAHNDSYRGTVA